MDGKASCTTCNHPASEHSEIEGLDGRGHCKVPGCECGAFVLGAEQPSSPPQGARHTLIARATDAEGMKGINLVAAGGPGISVEIPEDVAMELGKQAQREYRNLFGEDAVHVGVAGLPFLHDQDKEPGGYNMPASPGIYLKDGGTLEDAIEAIEECGPIIEKVPTENLRPRDKLLAALYPIDKVLAARVLMDEYETQGALVTLAIKLAELGTTQAIEVSNRIRAGEFDGES
jgi:hypothetical protein